MAGMKKPNDHAEPTKKTKLKRKDRKGKIRAKFKLLFNPCKLCMSR